MFDQLHDMAYDLVRERLLDARRERMAVEEAEVSGARFTLLRLRFANRLGDMLIAWGVRLKHQEPCQDLAKGWVWQDHR
jgi:hypothetical protein